MEYLNGYICQSFVCRVRSDLEPIGMAVGSDEKVNFDRPVVEFLNVLLRAPEPNGIDAYNHASIIRSKRRTVRLARHGLTRRENEKETS